MYMNNPNISPTQYRQTPTPKPKRLSKEEIRERVSGLKVATTFVSVIGFGVLTSIVAMHVVGVTSNTTTNTSQNSTQNTSSTGSQSSSTPSSQATQPSNSGGFNFGSGFNNPAPVSGSGGS